MPGEPEEPGGIPSGAKILRLGFLAEKRRAEEPQRRRDAEPQRRRVALGIVLRYVHRDIRVHVPSLWNTQHCSSGLGIWGFQ
jgi:hypothetical protein